MIILIGPFIRQLIFILSLLLKIHNQTQPISSYKMEQNTNNPVHIPVVPEVHSNNNHDHQHHIVIVGAGMAGLIAAKEILQSSASSSLPPIKVTIVETNDYIGGRIKGDYTLVPKHVIQTGAELVHGKQTLLTELIDRYYDQKWKDNLVPSNEKLQKEYFLLSHADGGPACDPTNDEGKYGMYYVNNELMMYNDERLRPLEQMLEMIHGEYEHYYDNNKHNASTRTGAGNNDDDKNRIFQFQESTSMGDVLLNHNNNNVTPLSPSLQSLTVASYGNTVGSCNLNHISLSLLMDFERYWQENEEEGDIFLTSKIGMSGIVKELVEELMELYGDKNAENHNKLDIRLNWTVDKIENNDDAVNEENVQNITSTSLVNDDNDIDDHPNVLKADYVIVTTPPPLWKNFIPNLPSTKYDAIERVGLNKAIKCAFKLKSKIWPDEKIQSIIMANCPIPEMWFDTFYDCNCNEGDEEDHGDENCCSYVAIGFLTSELADEFISMTDSLQISKVTDIFCDQMAKVFSIPVEEIRLSHIETRVYKWNHAYMFPKVGFTKGHLEELAKPMGNIHFAGEATNMNAPCTVQAAMETGVREAQLIIEKIKK
jgi:monoamine oxidase